MNKTNHLQLITRQDVLDFIEKHGRKPAQGFKEENKFYQAMVREWKKDPYFKHQLRFTKTLRDIQKGNGKANRKRGVKSGPHDDAIAKLGRDLAESGGGGNF